MPRNVPGAGKNRLDEGKLKEKWHAVAGKCGAAVFRKTLFCLVRSREIVLRDWDQRPRPQAVIRDFYQGIAVTTASTGTDPQEQ
jgi:hypothetical protein